MLNGAALAVSPMVVPPSMSWSGDNGKWSTFYVGLGTPAQALKLLPGTSAVSNTIPWVVLPNGCYNVNPTLKTCEDDRGGTFRTNQSTTWSTQGLQNVADGALYGLITEEEGHLGLAGNGSYGYDTISIGLGVSTNPAVITKQLIAGLWTNDFFLGYLPLSPLPFYYTLSESTPSVVGNLRNQSLIPSLSWGYTAGAFYRDSRTSRFGSLVLGGYDASRLISNNVVFSFGSDVSRDLLLQLRSITYDTVTGSPLLASSINVFIDSMVAELWLPVSVCEAFATTFNLTYHAGGNYYLVSEQAHSSMLKQNPTFTFTLSNGSSNVQIALPYAAFDLNLTMPIVGDTTRFFPIRRGQNESQYVLGRAFLQEAYVYADYERSQFSVAQAVFPSTSVSQKLITIEPVTNNTYGAANNSTNSSATGSDARLSGDSSGTSKAGLNAGVIAGIAVGLVAVLAILGMVLFFCWRKRKAPANYQFEDYKVQPEESIAEADAKSPLVNERWMELSTDANAHEMEAYKLHEMEGRGRPHEMSEKPDPYEMDGHQEPVELEAATPVRWQRHK